MSASLDLDLPELARIGLMLFAVAFALAPIATLLARRIYPGRNIFFARWGFSHLSVVLLTAVASSIVASMLFGQWVPAAAMSPGSPVSPGSGVSPGAGGETVSAALSTLTLGGEAVPVFVLSMGAQALMWLLTAGAILLIVRRVSPEGLGALGLRASRVPASILVGLIAYVLLFPGMIGLGMISRWLLDVLGHASGPQAVALEIGRLGAPWFSFAAVFAILLGPLFEELAFRGFLQPLFVQNFGDKGGIVLTSVAFAAMHGAVAFLPIFGLSLILGAVMLRTQRLWAPLIVHVLNNAIMIAALRLPETQELMTSLLLF